MATAFKILLGMSPVLAILLYFVLNQMHQQDVQMAVDKEQFKLDKERFHESFERSEFELADDNESKVYHLNEMRFHKAAANRIEEAKAEAVKRERELREKTDNEFADMEKTLDSFDEKSLDF